MKLDWIIRQIILRTSQLLAILFSIILVSMGDDFKISHAATLAVVALVCVGLSILYSDTHSFSGFVVALFICVNSMLYEKFRIKNKLTKKCYRIRKQFGSYLCCYDFCAYRYDKYREEN